jgi:hypothetical protein
MAQVMAHSPWEQAADDNAAVEMVDPDAAAVAAQVWLDDHRSQQLCQLTGFLCD